MSGQMWKEVFGNDAQKSPQIDHGEYYRLQEENARLRKEQVVYVGADSAEHDALISKIADMRPTLFTDAEIDYYGLNHSPEFVLDAISDKMVQLRKALEFYADETSHKAYKREAGAFQSKATDDGGLIAREALNDRNYIDL